MTRIAIACLLIFTAVNLGFIAPVSDSNTGAAKASAIGWDDQRKLVWQDFKGTPKNWGNISALTASAIEYSYNCDRGELEISINAYFFPKDSWVKSDARNAYILAHEQLHFDITELYARKLRMEMSRRINGCQDIRKIDAVARMVLDQWKKDQTDYDRETHHSLRREEQEQWNREVAKALNEHNAFTADRWDGRF